MKPVLAVLFILFAAPAAFAMPSAVMLHQSMLLEKLESAYQRYCRVATVSRSTECFTKSILVSSSRTLSKTGLEKILNRELIGNVHLNRKGLRAVDFKTGILALVKRTGQASARDSLSAARDEVLASADSGASSWIDGVLWTGVDHGDLVVLQKPDPAHDINEILVLFAGSQIESF